MDSKFEGPGVSFVSGGQELHYSTFDDKAKSTAESFAKLKWGPNFIPTSDNTLKFDIEVEKQKEDFSARRPGSPQGAAAKPKSLEK